MWMENQSKEPTNQNALSHSKEVAKERSRKPYIALGVVGVLAASSVFAGCGVVRAIENHKIIDNETTASGGKSEIIKFDDTFESHCWTATTIQISDAVVKNETRVLGVSTGWKSTTVSMKMQEELCIDGTPLDVSVNTDTGHVDVNLPSKSVIRTEISLVPGSLKPVVDQTPSYVFSDTFQKVLQSTPFLEDTALAKQVTDITTSQENTQLNMGVVIGMDKAQKDCGPTVLEMAKPASEQGIKNIYKRGLMVAQKMHPEINPDDISILVEGKPYSEITIDGTKSSIDQAYAAVKKIDAADDSFSIDEGKAGTCEASPDIKVPDTASKPVVEAKG